MAHCLTQRGNSIPHAVAWLAFGIRVMVMVVAMVIVMVMVTVMMVALIFVALNFQDLAPTVRC